MNQKEDEVYKSRRSEVLARLLEFAALGPFEGDAESQHMEADQLLLKLIDDPEITNAFNRIEKWYA